MPKETPNYFAIIPASVRYNQNLCANSKLLYGEITALSNKEGYSWATNKYFSELYGVHKNTISKWINSLAKEGFIRIQVTNKDDGFDRKIYINEYTPKQKAEGGINEKLNTPKRKAEHNNTINNTINIYTQKLLNAWIENGLPKHSIEVVNNNFKKKHIEKIESLGIELFLKMITDYAFILKSEDHYYTYKFSLWDFIIRGHEKFLPELNPYENFLCKDKIKKKQPENKIAVTPW